MKISIQNIAGNSQGEIEVPFEVIGNAKGEQAVHDTVVAYRAAQRSGTACTKTMGEVAGSGKKPWKQKGTGRARAGSKRSPIWRGGGVVFGPKPRDFRKTLNKGTKRLALRKALGERIKSGDVLVVDELTLSAPKTKEFLKIFNGLALDGTALFVCDEGGATVNLAARNLKYVEVTSSSILNTYQVLRPDKLVFTKAALENVGKRLNGN